MIGQDGISDYPEIETRTIKILEEKVQAGEIPPDIMKAAASKVRTAARALDSMGVLSKEQLKLPLRPNMYAYRLSDIGSRLYSKHFQSEAVISELEKIIAEHDNADHGYGILDVAKILEASGNFLSVNAFNRANPIEIRPKVFYVPDILAKSKKGVAYFEYERGLHTQNDFNAKCNKMAKATRWLNFIVPNAEIMETRIIPQIKSWIESRGGPERLKGLKARITPARAVKGVDLLRDEAWQVVFDMETTEPIREVKSNSQS